MQQARDEISHYGDADYLIINEDFDRALDDLRAVFRAVRLEQARQQHNNCQLLADLLT